MEAVGSVAVLDCSNDRFGDVAVCDVVGGPFAEDADGMQEDAVTAVTREEFGMVVEASKCHARVKVARGNAGHSCWSSVIRQCGRKPVAGSNFCAHHRKRAPFGILGDLLTREQFEKFEKERELRATLPKTVRRGRHCYTRHLMWRFALKVRAFPHNKEKGVLNYLVDLSFDERREALQRTNDFIRFNCRDVVEQGCGPWAPADVDDEDFARYNGRGGGRVFKYFEPDLFLTELGQMGVDASTCTERQCMSALGNTSAHIAKNFSAEYMKGMVQFAGPQCYPHLRDGARMRANEQHGRGGWLQRLLASCISLFVPCL